MILFSEVYTCGPVKRLENAVPSRHIPDPTWSKVEKETYKAVVKTGTVITEKDMLDYLILRGLEVITEDDYRSIADKKKPRSEPR